MFLQALGDHLTAETLASLMSRWLTGLVAVGGMRNEYGVACQWCGVICRRGKEVTARGAVRLLR